ncbi:MAG TPA: sulfotransferase [Phenylobacterium sp.]|jgi:tetratricopeptide (TPR) repeat protein
MSAGSNRPVPSTRRPADPVERSRRLDEAAAHFKAGRLDAAAQVYRSLEREAPEDVRAAYSLAVIDIGQGRLARARRRLESVVARDPTLAAAQHNLGAVCQQLGAWAEAADAYSRAAALNPRATGTSEALAVALAILGRPEAAITQYRILARDPAQRWAALTRIALLNASAVDDGELTDMLRTATDEASDIETRTGLLFALGDVLEARGRHDHAFVAYADGNRLKRGTLVGASEPASVAAANDAAARYVQDLFCPKLLAKRSWRGSRSTAPIFIVGMPRSGSTLIEQILASHPEVQGLGETGVLPDLLSAGYPDTVAGLRDLGDRYLAAMRLRGWDGVSRFVDKTLENYLHVGAIHLMFPQALILHSDRDAMDVCFACFRQLFTAGNETLYDLGDIGAEYLRYRGLMDHWRAVLPGRVADVSYEALAGDPERGIPALVTAAAGLAWDPACLRFFDEAGAVRTASATQVRRPVYQSSVQRWRRHAADLAPLSEALGALGPGLG